MSKPWDNEKTPTTDAETTDGWFQVVESDVVSNIERRMRHAEALLKDTIEHGFSKSLHKAMISHIAHAQQEDAQ